MRVSQLLKVMDKESEIIINDDNKDILNDCLYHGYVRGIKRDDPINKYHVTCILGSDEAIVVFAVEPKKKGE